MTVIQQKMIIQSLYIQNGDYKYIPFNNIEELETNAHLITNYGYNAIGVNYLIPNVGEYSMDVYVKNEGDVCFELSKDVYNKNITFDLKGFEYCKELKQLKEIAHLF